MSPAGFHDAISKGLGRVIRHLRSGVSVEPYLESIKHACTVNLSYDVQCEGIRDEYLFEIMDLSKRMDALACDVAQALRAATGSREIWQGFSLCFRLAQAGYSDARAAMYERVGTISPPEDTQAGIGAIVELDGSDGLIEVITQFGNRILAGECIEFEGYHIACAEELLGEGLRERLLEPLAAMSPAVRAVLECIDRKAELDRTRTRERPLENKPYAHVRAELEARQGNIGLGHLRSWARSACEEDLRAAAQDLLTEMRPDFLHSYLRIFFDRPFPLSLDRLIELGDSGDQKLSHAAMLALSSIENPAVRVFALDLLRRGHRLANALGLLELNFLPGDHLAIMDALTNHEMDRDTVHGVGLDLLGIFEERELPECRDVLLWVYENTPCSLCRNGTVKILVSAGCIPEHVLKECLDDSLPETRTFARECGISPS